MFRSQVLPRVRNYIRKRWNQDHSEGIHRENSEEVQHGECKSCRDSNHQKLTEYWTREGREQISLSFCSWSIDIFNGRYKTRYCLCSWSCIKIFRESNRRWYCESQEDFQIPSRDSESWYQILSWFSQRSRGLQWCRSCWRLSNSSVYYWGHLLFCRRCCLLVQSKTSICFDFNHRGWNCSFKWISQRISVAKEALCRFDSYWQNKAFLLIMKQP